MIERRVPAVARRGLLGRAIRHPLLWLVLLLVVVFSTRDLEPLRVPDTASYIKAANFLSLERGLAYYRTQGYPLFLRSVQRDGARWNEIFARVPRVQVLVYFSGIVLFWLGVASYSRSPWLGFAASLPLPFARTMGLANSLQPDFLAAAFLLAAVACLLMLQRHRRSPVLWVGLATTVFMSYQLRPAGMFLVGLVPVLGAVLARALGRASWRRVLRDSLVVTAVTVLPFVAFAGLRRHVVGHFGLVSFAGSNLAGTAACYLDLDLTRRLEPRHREMARKIVEFREARGWRAMTLSDDPELWFEQYSQNIWQITRPVARALTERELDERARQGQRPIDSRPPLVIWDERLGDMSKDVIRRRPGLHSRWIVAAIGYGLKQLPDHPWIVWPTALLALSIPAARFTRRRPRRLGEPMGIVLVAVTYFASYLIAVSCVSFPFERYFISTVLLVPSALCGLLFAFWAHREPVRQPQPSADQEDR